MSDAVGLLETTGLTPALVAVDAMLKAAAVRVLQAELNDLLGVCVKITGPVAEVQTAIQHGRTIAEQMLGQPVTQILTRPAAAALPGIRSRDEFNPLIQQSVVFPGDLSGAPATDRTASSSANMNASHPQALGFIETQGFTAVFEAIDAACKAADVEVVAKEKLGGGYVTVVVQGELSAVTAAVAAGQAGVAGLGKLIAAHVVARPSSAVLKLMSKL